MDHSTLFKLLKKLNLPVAYDHFEENDNLVPPFCVYREIEPDTFKADNKVYAEFNNFEIELVTKKKDVALEKKITDLLSNNNIPYDKSNSWDKDEKIYHIFYEI